MYTYGRPPRMLLSGILFEDTVQRLAAQVYIALRRRTAARPTRARNHAPASRGSAMHAGGKGEG
eukprot:815320-Pyramimonas_sp.AAC.1